MTSTINDEKFPKTRTSQPALKKLKVLSIALFGFGSLTHSHSLQAIPRLELQSIFSQGAKFEYYMATPLRQELTDARNSNLDNPYRFDASNWTGCQIGKGILSGTFRDISACAASDYYGREIGPKELGKLTYEEASCIIESIWNSIEAHRIPNQDVANIVMHIQMHFGNIRIVQSALNDMGANLEIDGRVSEEMFDFLIHYSRWAPTYTYNQIRDQLAAAYKQSPYRVGFMKFLNKEFPKKLDIFEQIDYLANCCINALSSHSEPLLCQLEWVGGHFFDYKAAA